jgi:hypothetical protein
MKKGLTELVFILDKSASMGGLEFDTIGDDVPTEELLAMIERSPDKTKSEDAQ